MIVNIRKLRNQKSEINIGLVLGCCPLVIWEIIIRYLTASQATELVTITYQSRDVTEGKNLHLLWLDFQIQGFPCSTSAPRLWTLDSCLDRLDIRTFSLSKKRKTNQIRRDSTKQRYNEKRCSTRNLQRCYRQVWARFRGSWAKTFAIQDWIAFIKNISWITSSSCH